MFRDPAHIIHAIRPKQGLKRVMVCAQSPVVDTCSIPT